MSGYYSGPPSAHFDGTRFFIPGHPTDKTLRELWRWHWHASWRGGRAAWPEQYPSPFAGARPPPRSAAPRVTLIGHASFLIQVAGRNMLVDPVYSDRASPVRWAGPLRVNPPGIDFDDLPPIDTVLLTHNHYDHLDFVTLGRLWQRFRPRIIAPLGNDTVIHRRLPEVSVDVLDWGQAADLGDGVTSHLEPSLHWSARGLGDRRMALWGAFVLTTPGGVIYHVGDTAYGDGRLFRAVRDRYGAPRLAILPIGAYAPRWLMANQHMDPLEAVHAFEDCGAAEAVGHHWGTFQLTDEPIDAPVKALAATGVNGFHAFRPGEVWGG